MFADNVNGTDDGENVNVCAGALFVIVGPLSVATAVVGFELPLKILTTGTADDAVPDTASDRFTPVR